MNPCMAVETTRELFDVLINLGADKELLQNTSGVQAKHLLEAESRFPVEKHLNLWRAGQALLEEEALGLDIGASSNPYLRGIVGLVFAASPDLSTAIDNKVKYTHILADHISLKFTRHKDSFSLTYSILDGYYHRYEIERVFSGFLNWVRVFVESSVFPTCVSFQYEKPDSYKKYQQYLGENIQFDQPMNQISFSLDLLQHKNIKFNEYLYNILQARADRMLSELGKEVDFLSSVRSTIAGRLCHGHFSILDVAKAHNISTRTLHRKLQEVQLNYQSILDDVRKEMAISYLTNEGCSPQAVSFLIGYADERAFHRAFKRWTGSSIRKFLDEK